MGTYNRILWFPALYVVPSLWSLPTTEMGQSKLLEDCGSGDNRNGLVFRCQRI